MKAFGWITLALVTTVVWGVLFVSNSSLSRQLRAAQAEVKRLKAQPPTKVESEPECFLQAPGVLEGFGCLTTKQALWLIEHADRFKPKPQPKRAALPPFPKILNSGCGTVTSDNLTDNLSNVITLPLEPQTGPMMLQNSRGVWHPWRSEQVPIKK